MKSASIDSLVLECSAASAYLVKRRIRVGTPGKSASTTMPNSAWCAIRAIISFWHAGLVVDLPDMDEFSPCWREPDDVRFISRMIADAGYDSRTQSRLCP